MSITHIHLRTSDFIYTTNILWCLSQNKGIMYRRYLKRGFDIFFSAMALLMLSPIIGVVWIWLTIANKGAGAIFYQERPGKDEKIFRIYKFKSMTDERDATGALLPDAQRLTKVGRFVRSTSIDELPQLWNVLKGDMSFIGPRPLLVKYLPYYSTHEKLRHNVRPGITGLAQVNGRNNLDWDKRLELDSIYVQNYSLKMDIKILTTTVINVIKRKDIMAPSESHDLDVIRRNCK